MSVIYRETERLELLRAQQAAARDTGEMMDLQDKCDTLQQKVRAELQVFFELCKPWRYLPEKASRNPR